MLVMMKVVIMVTMTVEFKPLRQLLNRRWKLFRVRVFGNLRRTSTLTLPYLQVKTSAIDNSVAGEGDQKLAVKEGKEAN